MSYSQKYCIVSFIRPLSVGYEFEMSKWPLHITLVGVFSIDRLDSNITNQLSKLLEIQHPILTQAEADTNFGDTKVVLVEKSDSLLTLHVNLVDLLETNGAQLKTPLYSRDGYLPHSTIQGVERLRIGEEAMINTISLIDMFPGGNWQQRKVLQNFKLKG
jgi:hypothetical protein